ncbi:hypothetical protein LFAB_16695 [Lactiplantibacillus fabifermentans T30PCM01]|uniref:HXXEE domain-containing protein n=1 Tax=Lactiplantibacillus fabifermentans T30PCM01 TaxID=1400520 RepID=W6T3X4_9LACO|nr:HXXEE domain-containing protein [Lactiplantibacillus fabifermentans]ETY72597.1 hypothetical protein LFAB_16695 [Lactiplantibacillus fabifermentans T30PCM01]
MSKLVNNWFKIWLSVIAFLAGETFFAVVSAGSWMTWQQRIIGIFLTVLVVHIIEEGTLPGGFFYMYNTVFDPQNKLYDRYPINRFSEMIENFFGVLVATACFWFWPNTVTVIMWFAVCLVEIPGHLVTGIKMRRLLRAQGKVKRTIYNPGLVSDLLGFLPLAIVMLVNLVRTGTTWQQWLGGLALGVVSMLVCIQIPDKLLMNKKSRYVYTNGYGYFDKFGIRPDQGPHDK